MKIFASCADVTGLVETRDCLEYADNLFADLRVFNVFRRARDRRGGGVALVVKKALKGYRRPDLEHSDLEILMIDVSSANIIVCVFYSPPVNVRVTTIRFVEHIRSLSHEVIQRLVILGDFNVPDVDWTGRSARTLHGHALLEAAREFNFKQIVDFPTRLENILDLAFLPVAVPYDCLEAIPAPTDKCDHLALQFRAFVRKRNARLISRLRWKFDDRLNAEFKESLKNIDWFSLFAGHDASEKAVILEDTVVSIAKNFHHLTRVKQRFGQVSYPSFVTRALRRRDRVFRRWRDCTVGPRKDQLRQKWRKCSRLADCKAKQYQQHQVMQAATSTRNQKKFWRLVKSSADVQSVPPLWNDQSSAFEFTDSAKANLLNDWFVSCQQPCATHCDVVSALSGSGSFPEPITEQEINRALKQVLTPGKASGPFVLSFDLLARCGSEIIPPLIMLFNTCLFSSVFPACWKASYVTAIPKGSVDSTRYSNWRPISLLHPLSKVLEVVIASRLRVYLESHSLLSNHQYGFRQKRSTELLATTTVQEWMDEIARGHSVDAVFLDCQKAFDRADHEQIILSLFKFGVSSVLLKFFSDYLRGRHQVTLVDGTHSEQRCDTSGVPQGSILGPLLFLCLIDAVATCTSSKTAVRMFADDIAIYRVVHGPDDTAEFQLDLDAVCSWSAEVKLAFNPTKSVFVRFSAKQIVPEAPEYRLGLDTIPRRNTVKYLGLHLDRKLSWSDHISNLITKVRKRMRYISFLFSRSCQRARITLYKSLVLPLLDYCCVVYNPRLKGLIDGLEDCTRTFLQSINLGPALEDTSVGRYSNRLRQLGLEPLILRRIRASLILAYKMIFGLIPVSNQFFSPLCLDTAGLFVSGGTRAAGALRAHPCPLQLSEQTDQGWAIGHSEKSFAFLVARIWNDLPFDAAAYESLPSFSLCIHELNFFRIKYVMEIMGKYSEFLTADSPPQNGGRVR